MWLFTCRLYLAWNLFRVFSGKDDKLYFRCVFIFSFQAVFLSNSYCPLDFLLAPCHIKCHSEWVTIHTCCLTHFCPFSLLSLPFPQSVSCSILLIILVLFIPLLISSLLLSSIHLISTPPCVLLASLSSLLITPFPSPGSSLTSSCASSYQRRWLRSQTTSLENGVFPRWWDAYNHTHKHRAV